MGWREIVEEEAFAAAAAAALLRRMSQRAARPKMQRRATQPTMPPIMAPVLLMPLPLAGSESAEGVGMVLALAFAVGVPVVGGFPEGEALSLVEVLREVDCDAAWELVEPAVLVDCGPEDVVEPGDEVEVDLGGVGDAVVVKAMYWSVLRPFPQAR